MQELANRYLLVNGEGDGDNKHILTEQKNNFQNNNNFFEYVDSGSLLYPIPNF